ncbi:MAG: DUF1292 domain-containing protein [Clostridia bacterium]|nr:DUF1292 domain-containing protein [Clostridia bacterium]
MDNTYDDDDIVTLKAESGEDIDFVEIAGIAYRGRYYAILQPVELMDGMGEDDALVFQVTRGSDGEDKFAIELDDDTIDAVFAEYNKLLDEAENEDKYVGKKKPVVNSRGNKSTTKKASAVAGAGKKIFKIVCTVAAVIIIFIAILLLKEGLSTGDSGGVIFAVVIIAIVLLVYFAIIFALRNREERKNGGSNKNNRRRRR